ncbi:flotillin-2-like [Sinocyclocheilus anshuiensis]|uniref:flotillin-2-like n=1 Tax=Sinocyclocheilus anshuiensis TaxID=1608454 RepID=UPI0007B8EC0F|nr:PREDICTED: flotillin-2-like [Sinocyclocheilus anshuiensis]
MGCCLTVGPNEALVVSGACCGSDAKTYVVGGWAWAWWLISDTQRITLEIMTLQPKCEDVETAEGVAITVTGVAQVKVMTDKDLLAVACEQFLGKSVMEIKAVVLQTLEGHLRSILGTLTVEQIYQDRDEFARLVREVAAPDVGRMGIEILSFTIKDVYDKLDYLSSLGKTQTAAVQRDADIGVAEAERDAGIREAECKKEMMDVKFLADTKMADSKRELELQKAAFNQEVNTKKAESQLAYELQAAKEQQKIRLEEIEIEVVQRKKQISIEEKEIERTEKELIATVKRPAEDTICMSSMCLYACLTTSGHAPNETTDGVLGCFLPDLDQGITELLDSLRCNLAASDGPKHNVPLPGRTACILSPHEAGHCRAPGGTQPGPTAPAVHLCFSSTFRIMFHRCGTDVNHVSIMYLRNRSVTHTKMNCAIFVTLNRLKKVLIAQAEAEKIRKVGEAEAISISSVGKAEAERMRLKAEAYQQYGEAAKTALVLEALPKIAGKVAAPLARTNEIVILSGDGSRVTGEVNRLLAELPVSVNALTGVDLSKIPLLQKMTGAQA